MRDACYRDAHAHVEVLVEYVMLGHPDVVQDLPELLVEPVGLGRVGRGVSQMHAAVVVDRHPVVRLGDVLRDQPEVDGVASDIGQAPVRRQLGELGLLALHRLRVGLPAHLDVAERPFAAIAREVEVVQAESLLEHRVVPLLTERYDGLAVVIHVVAADLPRTVGQALRMPVRGRPEQDRGAVRRPGGHRHDVPLVHLVAAAAADHDQGDAPSGRICLEALRLRVHQQGHAGTTRPRTVSWRRRRSSAPAAGTAGRRSRTSVP